MMLTFILPIDSVDLVVNCSKILFLVVTLLGTMCLVCYEGPMTSQGREEDSGIISFTTRDSL